MTTTEITKVSEESRQLDHMKPNRLTDSLFAKDLAPHYMKLAGQLAASEMVPKCFRNKPSDLFLCWAMGYQIGIPPEQAMNCIMVLNGKAVMWGDEMLALCMTHPDFLDITEVPINGQNGTITGYICTIKRRNRTDTVSEFTMEMAKKAGLQGKGGVWSQYPDRMLKLRARGFALRDAFPDALKGIKSREEVEDYVVEAEYTSSEPKTSRTERLKQEILTKQGISNVDLVCGSVVTIEDKISIETPEENKEHRHETKDIGDTVALHLKIKELIAEKQFSEERLIKALNYYQVDKIEDLTLQEATHFASNLK